MSERQSVGGTLKRRLKLLAMAFGLVAAPLAVLHAPTAEARMRPQVIDDADFDNVEDTVDNCEFDWNPNQEDLNDDGEGDACDVDIDGDAFANGGDNCDYDPDTYGGTQANYDGDSEGDVCDDDMDNDGDDNDSFFEADTDDDGTANGADGDDDDDGIGDGGDNCPTQPNPAQFNFDGDPWGNSCDDDIDGDGRLNWAPLDPFFTADWGNGYSPWYAECSAGFYSQDGDGLEPCLPAPPGYYVPTDEANFPIPCERGTWQQFWGQTSCDDATPGHYVNIFGSPEQFECAPGYYMPDFNAWLCTPADVNHAVPGTGSTFQSPCAPGYEQPLTGQDHCNLIRGIEVFDASPVWEVDRPLVSKAVFLVVLAGGPSNVPVSVKVKTVNGSAIGGRDFTPVNTVLNFAPGQDYKYVYVTIMPNAGWEGPESFSLQLSNSTGAPILYGGTATGTILADSITPTISVSNETVDETDGYVTFDVNLSNPYPRNTVAVTITARNGNALAGKDYLYVTTRITFNPGETAKTFSVPVRTDGLTEDDEWFKAQLTSPTRGFIGGGGYGKATITGNAT